MDELTFKKIEIDSVSFAVAGTNLNSDGQAIVFLHGYMTYSSTWDLVRQHLSLDRPMYFIDLPGAGRSARPNRDLPLTAASLASRLLKLLRQLGVNSCDVVGTQMGGSLLGYMLAEQKNNQQKVLRKCIIIAAGALGESKGNMEFYRKLGAPLSGYVTRKFMPKKKFLLMWRAAHGSAYVPDVERENLFFKHFRQRGTDMTVIALQVRASYGETYDDLMEKLQGSDDEVVLIWGKDDIVVPVETGERFLEAITNSRLVVLDGVGDFPQEEAPRQVAEEIRRFFVDETNYLKAS